MSSGWNIVNRAIRQAMESVSLADMAHSLSPSMKKATSIARSSEGSIFDEKEKTQS